MLWAIGWSYCWTVRVKPARLHSLWICNLSKSLIALPISSVLMMPGILAATRDDAVGFLAGLEAANSDRSTPPDNWRSATCAGNLSCYQNCLQIAHEFKKMSGWPVLIFASKFELTLAAKDIEEEIATTFRKNGTTQKCCVRYSRAALLGCGLLSFLLRK